VTIDGKPVKARQSSPPHGFFYAIDRADGHFIYAFRWWRDQLDLGPRSRDRPAEHQCDKKPVSGP